MGSSPLHTVHLLGQCPCLPPPPRHLPSRLLPSLNRSTWAPLEAALRPTSSSPFPPTRPSGFHWSLAGAKNGFWRRNARESSITEGRGGGAESEEFSVLAAVRSEYNEIVIVETAKSRFLLLDSTRMCCYPFV